MKSKKIVFILGVSYFVSLGSMGGSFLGIRSSEATQQNTTSSVMTAFPVEVTQKQPELFQVAPMCKDPDGRNYNNKGTTTIVDGGGNIINTKTDSCHVSTYNDYHDWNGGVIRRNLNDGVVPSCENGCEVVHDTVLGIAVIDEGYRCTVCSVQEYVCENGEIQSELYFECPYGCSDGRCSPPPPPLDPDNPHKIIKKILPEEP